MSSRQLTRSRSNRFLAGVAGGIAEYTGIDSGIVRLVTALLVCFTGVGLLAYILAWIVLAEEGSATSGLDQIISTFRQSSKNNRSSDLR